jgi:hypothetical protein
MRSNQFQNKPLGLWRPRNHARHPPVFPDQTQSLPVGARFPSELLPKDEPQLTFNGIPAFEHAYPVLPSQRHHPLHRPHEPEN